MNANVTPPLYHIPYSLVHYYQPILKREEFLKI